MYTRVFAHALNPDSRISSHIHPLTIFTHYLYFAVFAHALNPDSRIIQFVACARGGAGRGAGRGADLRQVLPSLLRVRLRHRRIESGIAVSSQALQYPSQAS